MSSTSGFFFLFVGRKHLHLFCFLLQCLNLTQLLDYYGLSPHSLISPSQFTYLCPALLYQIDSRVCIRHYHQMNVEQEASENISAGKKLVSTWSMSGLSQPEATTGNIHSVIKKKKKNLNKCISLSGLMGRSCSTGKTCFNFLSFSFPYLGGRTND